MIDALAPMSQSEFNPPWADLQFEIVSADWAEDPARLVIACSAEVENSEVGFGIEVRRDGWNRIDTDHEQIWFDWGRGTLFSTGQASDRLIDLLADIFELEQGQEFISRLDCDIVLLNSDPPSLMSRRCMSKFFLGEADDNEGQVFVNWDVEGGRVELREKDPDFRNALVRELTVH